MKYALALVSVLALAACSTPAPTTPTEAPAAAEEIVFPTTGLVDYQLGGGYEPPAGTTIVARDRTDVPAPGVFTICYVNGFQSQGADASFWLDEHPLLVLRDASGDPVYDENWPDEFLFDTSTDLKRTALSSIVGDWIDGCAADGFDAVEFDNLDSFTRSGDLLTEENNVAFATILAARAHKAGLQAGQKNSAELSANGPAIGFDFAVAEECHRWDECGAYTEVYGNHVVDIEYFDDLRGAVADVCADENTPTLTVVRDRNLATPESAEYRYEVC